MTQQQWIQIRGARVHNLQNVEAMLPRNCLTVLTGPSGSGKSSLAFDTLYAEGQRRYLETLRVDTRALFDQLQRPDVDLVAGMPPPLCVSQITRSMRPRSTLSTITEIENHLRLLFSRAGVPHCYQCGKAIRRSTIREIVEQLSEWEDGTKMLVLAPLSIPDDGGNEKAFEQIRQAGFVRARIDGKLVELQETPELESSHRHTIDMVVDRLIIRPEAQDRLRESISEGIRFGQGTVIVAKLLGDSTEDHRFTTRYACSDCGIIYSELEPRHFNFNAPHGACPECDGLGCVASDEIEETCPECHGARINREARSVLFADRSIANVHAMTVDVAFDFFRKSELAGRNETTIAKVLAALLPEIVQRLHFLKEVGLGYLTLNRPAPTLSGGEAQRARIATHLGAGLLGVCYILDEPTIGLHPRDTNRLLAALRQLQKRGSTVIMVEHDESVIGHADYLVEIGPGAGPEGGRVVVAGWRPEVIDRVLPKRTTPSQGSNWNPESTARISIEGAASHNLKHIDVNIPLACLICVTGVSGSGKSTLVYDVLAPATRRHLKLTGPSPGKVERIVGLQHIDKIIDVDQSPLCRSSRSTPATYTGIFDEIRRLFAKTREAKSRGFKANRFSFNVRSGRCEGCLGQGVQKVSLDLLPDLTVPCTQCGGTRFNPTTLEIRFKGKNIADVLTMSVKESLQFFANVPAVEKTLQVISDVGLGYMKLGQPAESLSGGESQRVKLATELARVSTGRTLLLLDEPTTGMHYSDVRRLIGVLRGLVEKGNTVVVVEHQLDVIAASDYVIDLGPDAGARGGEVVIAGRPDQIAACNKSMTGEYLRKHFSDKSNRSAS